MNPVLSAEFSSLSLSSPPTHPKPTMNTIWSVYHSSVIKNPVDGIVSLDSTFFQSFPSNTSLQKELAKAVLVHLESVCT